MAQSIKGKVAIITGASSGIGETAARRLTAEGAKVVLVARSGEKLQALAKELGKDALAVPTDLTKGADVDAMAAAALKRFGQIDILFANAGSHMHGDVVNENPDDWDAMISVNVNGAFRCVRAVLPGMIARRSGDIVMTSSISGHQAIQWEPVYSATKHAVQSFVHGTRRQIAPHNLRIGAIAPGMVLNALWGHTDPKEIEKRRAAHAGLLNEDVVDGLMFMLTRPAHVTIRDMVMLPQNQDL